MERCTSGWQKGEVSLLLGDVQGKHCLNLHYSLHKQGYDYISGMVIVDFYANANPSCTIETVYSLYY